MAKARHTDIRNRIQVCREYTALWQDFFSFFSESLEDKNITEDMEQRFDQLMSILALNHYKFKELCGEFMKEPEGILKILATAVSLDHMKRMQEANFHKLQVEWHTQFIDMNKALGKLLSKLPPKELAAMQEQQQQGTSPQQAS